MITKIYVLLCPTTKTIRYVGKTTQELKHRLKAHLTESKKADYHKARWVRNLQSPPIIKELIEIQEDDGETSDVWEQKLIQFFKNKGFKLVNTAPGGAGRPTKIGKLAPSAVISKQIIVTVLDLYNKNIQYKDISKTTGLNYKTIVRLLKENNIPLRQQGFDRKILQEALDQNMSTKDLMKKFNITYGAANFIRMGVSYPDLDRSKVTNRTTLKGQSNPCWKEATEEEKEKIMELRKKGYGYIRISESTGIGSGIVRKTLGMKY